ncbi:MAG: ABC transporter substrate-binding protein [Armatimonadota bacterium]|nr:ABC transporter substrate-binding protein [Armatimonadota bacterium]
MMRRGLSVVVMLLAVVLAVSGTMRAQGMAKVTVFEAWFIHNESMGDPVAVEKGFYRSLNLDVKVVGGGPGLSPIDRVMAEAKKGTIVFGVDYPYNILEAREKQKLPLVVVAHDFQKSAVRLISWKEIKSARDIEGTVATWIGYDKQIKAAIGPDWDKRIKIVNQQGDPATIGSWLKKDYVFAHAMAYNEVLVAKRQAKEKYWVYDFPSLGIDWPENVVFTTEEIVQKYPQVVQAFVTGRYQGYKYALANRQEAVQILVKYNSNLKGGEAHELEGMDAIAAIMITDATRKHGLGYVDPSGWERVARDMTRAKLFAAAPNYKAAFSTKFPSKVMP